MARWRELHERRDSRERESARGREWLFWFIGGPFACLLVGMGAWCALAESIPVATRVGTLYVGGVQKTGFAIVFFSVGAALHFGFVWPRIPGCRRCWVPLLAVSLAAAIVGFLLFGLSPARPRAPRPQSTACLRHSSPNLESPSRSRSPRSYVIRSVR